MRNYRNHLLAGLATLTLIAGTAAASAQEPSPGQGGAVKTPQATQQLNKTPGAGSAGKMGQSAQGPAQGPAAGSNKMGQSERAPNAGMVTQRSSQGQARTNASERNESKDEMRGLQANASGVNVQLSDEQRTRIRTTVIEGRGAPRAGSVKFDVTVGTVIPRTGFRIAPVPPTLVKIQPAWRGYRYFVYEGEVVIVDPHNMKIVAVLVV